MAFSFSSKRLRITALIILVMLALAGILHFWFSRNAARYLESVVSDQSGGKLQLQVKGFSYNLFTGFIEVRKGSLRSLDSSSNPATYNIRLDKLTLHIQSFWPLLLERRLLLDSVEVNSPEITIYRWRKDPDLLRSRDQVSLPSELGRLYQSLLDALDGLQLKRIIIRNAGMVLNDRINPNLPPVRLRHVDFDLQYPGGQQRTDGRKTGAQNARLHIPAQSLTLPDGKHRLSFKRVELEQFGQRLQLDSCTIATVGSKTGQSQFVFYFKKLLLSGMDFDALYRLNTIKADSVFCTSPMFRLVVQKDSVRAKVRSKAMPQQSFRNLLSDMGASLDLGFIGVRDAGFQLNFNGNKKRTISNTRHDDFSMRGLRINSDSSQPFSVAAFDMMVRGYELYNEDSSTRFRFDSIQFKNDRIVLRQFAAETLPGRNSLHNERRYTIPYFELQDLNWYALIFEDRLQARNAYMVNPDIYFRALKFKRPRNRQSLFEILETAGDLLSLEEVHVRNGNLHLVSNSRTDIKLKGASLVLRTTSLLQARSTTGIKNSVQQLQFTSGTITQANAAIQLKDVRYLEQEGLLAGSLHISNKNGDATLQQVALADALVDREANSIALKGLRWKKGSLRMQLVPATPKSNNDPGTISLEGLQGANTSLLLTGGNKRISVLVHRLSADRIQQGGGKPVQVAGLALQTGALDIHLGPQQIAAQSLHYRQHGAFKLEQLSLQQQTDGDTLNLQTASVSGIAQLEPLLQQQWRMEQVTVEQPQLVWRKRMAANPPPAPTDKKTPPLHIGSVVILRPSADLSLYKRDSASHLRVQPIANGRIELRNFSTEGKTLSLEKLLLQTGPVVYQTNDGRKLGTEKGSLHLEASQLKRSLVDGKPRWSGTVDSILLQQPTSIALGKKGARLNIASASAGNLLIPQTGNSLQELWHYPKLWLRTGTGTYRDSTTVMYWEKARYDALNNILSLDSLNIQPAVTREAFIATHPYQTDYITFQTGPVQLTGFDRSRFELEQFLGAEKITVQRPVITLYRDKRPPFAGGVNKPLPTNKLQQITTPLQIGKVQLQDGIVVYTELNPRTNEEGIITLTNLNATIENIRNRNITQQDSLYIAMDALLLDSAKMSLQLRESYADTLAGFVMQLKMRPTSLSFLNPVVAPLSSVNIVSGTVDSLYLNALGREHLALGEMHLFYRDLKVKLVQFGESKTPKVLLAVASFLANNLVIRTNNKGRKSLLYVERLRDRSVFNYLVKMTMSGIVSGVGVKSNKRILKQYKKDLERLQLPHFRNEQRLESLVKEKE